MGCLVPFGKNGCVGCVGCALPLLVGMLCLLLPLHFALEHHAPRSIASKGVALVSASVPAR